MPSKEPIETVRLKNGRTRYRARVDIGQPSGKREQKSRTFDEWEDARDWRIETLAAVRKGEHVKRDKGLTVEQYLTEWLASKSTKADNTQRAYADALGHVIRMHGELPLYDLDVPHVVAVRNGMLDGSLRRRGTAGEPLSAAAVNMMLIVLGAAMDSAVTRKLARFNPASSKLVDRVADPDKIERVAEARGSWLEEDAATFAEQVEGHQLRAAFLLSLLGLRRGEVLALEWDRDVDLDGSKARRWKLKTEHPRVRVTKSRVSTRNGVINGTPKTPASKRVVPIPPVVVAALKAVKAAQAEARLKVGSAWADTGMVFTDATGKGLRPEWYADQWLTQVKAAELPRIPLHGARHWCATLLNEHHPYGLVQAWLGHSKKGVTAGYVHESEEMFARIAVMFQRVLSGEASGGALTAAK